MAEIKDNYMGKRTAESLYSLPETKDVADRAQSNELRALLDEAHSLRGAEDRLKEIKKRMSELIYENGMLDEKGNFGARFGRHCCIVREQAGRDMLDRELLVEAGVTPDQIKKGTRHGKPYRVVELPEIEMEERG